MCPTFCSLVGKGGEGQGARANPILLCPLCLQLSAPLWVSEVFCRSRLPLCARTLVEQPTGFPRIRTAVSLSSECVPRALGSWRCVSPCWPLAGPAVSNWARYLRPLLWGGGSAPLSEPNRATLAREPNRQHSARTAELGLEDIKEAPVLVALATRICHWGCTCVRMQCVGRILVWGRVLLRSIYLEWAPWHHRSGRGG